jgi:hypothetical protein
MSTYRLLSVAALLLPSVCAANNTRSVYWYTSAGDATQVKDAASAATGHYMCCGTIKILANGTVQADSISQLASIVTAAGGLPVQHTVSVDANVSWDNANAGTLTASCTLVADVPLTKFADDIVTLVVASNAAGVMIDYEVPTSLWKLWGKVKTRAVANKYAQWANRLAPKLNAEGRTLGLDLSGDCGGSPIDLFDVFAANATNVDQLMLMSTYRDIHDRLFYEKELVSRAIAAGIPRKRISVGIGSISTSDPVRYGWNQTDLQTYLQWVAGQGITMLGIWRSDIDVYKPSEVKTAPFFIEALQAFLASGAKERP